MHGIEGPLGFKGLAYQSWSSEGGGCYSSPVRTHFAWPRSGLIAAGCERLQNPCRSIPRVQCGCGIYGTTNMTIAQEYLIRGPVRYGALVLIEALRDGRIIMAETGFRAARVKVRAIVSRHGPSGTWQSMLDQHAADFFDVPIVSAEAAREAVQIQWRKALEESPIG